MLKENIMHSCRNININIQTFWILFQEFKLVCMPLKKSVQVNLNYSVSRYNNNVIPLGLPIRHTRSPAGADVRHVWKLHQCGTQQPRAELAGPGGA